jgi:uncharacterized protein (DUF302 family)
VNDRQHGALGFAATIDAPFEDALARTRDALAAEQFGVLTAIDVRATFRDQLGADFEPCAILGVWNADLAWRALHADDALGLFLPWNVVVRQEGDRVHVEAADPERLWSLAGDNPELRAVAEAAAARLGRAIKAVGRSRRS